MSSNYPYYPDESIGMQPTQAYPPMEELQPRPPQPQYPPQGYIAPSPQPVTDVPQMLEPIESVETRQKKAMTVRFAIGKFNDYLLWFLTVLEVALAVRFLLKLIGADPNNLFAGFLFALTDIPLLPFLGIVKSPSIHTNQSFEFSTLIAMLIYWLLFYALRRFFRLLVSSPEDPVE
ncbi:MAG TPA: YggT family protein [Ktedonobacteraceae bacterium]|nr:YggT family protein [Ktedonobacteraceae bacterium]